MFNDRTEELAYLEQIYQERSARFLIMYGRRRIGKTELLRHFSQGKPHLFFASDLSSEQEQLRQFTEKLAQVANEAFLRTQPFTSWEAAFRYIFDHLVETVPLIIIDEFPYLCASNPALPSILQKVWDECGKDTAAFLIVCGSYMSFMEKEVLGNKSPLFGRRTGQILLQPLDFQELQAFFPRYAKEDLVYTYAILGGTPAYLQRFSDAKPFAQNIAEQILNKNAALYSEPRFLLMEELREPSLYFSILKAIAFGKTKLNEIVQETGMTDRHTVNKYLAVLQELYMIRREVPVTEEHPQKFRRGIYFLHDPFFRFWFRYVFPNFSYLEEGDIEYVWREKIEPDLETFVGPIFEQICLQTLKRLNRANQLPFKAARIGRWWDGTSEIDVLAYNERGAYLLCECKWSTRPVGLNVLRDLEAQSAAFTKSSQRYFGLFSRSGFQPELHAVARQRQDVFLFEY